MRFGNLRRPAHRAVFTSDPFQWRQRVALSPVPSPHPATTGNNLWLCGARVTRLFASALRIKHHVTPPARPTPTTTTHRPASPPVALSPTSSPPLSTLSKSTLPSRCRPSRRHRFPRPSPRCVSVASPSTTTTLSPVAALDTLRGVGLRR
ncbi:hypothetical protein C8R45DRAFT_1211994 [Mycena sanguinolenta]|nr:hypothetical protein C8R45DRAFT_1211994 [Mycena sanguinolenta]